MYSHGTWTISLPCDMLKPFSSRLGKSSKQTQVLRVSTAVRDNHKQHQLCLAKLAPLFASISASWRSHFLRPVSFTSISGHSQTILKKTQGSLCFVPNPFGVQMQRPSKLIKSAQIFKSEKKTNLFFSSGMILVILVK